MGSHRAARSGSRRSTSGHSVVPSATAATPAAGKRRAARHSGSRGPLFRILPSTPVLAGVATLAISVGGALATGNAAHVHTSAAELGRVAQASAMGGTSGVSSASLLAQRGSALSRDSDREAGAPATSKVEAKAQERDKALQQFQKAANAQDAKIALNLWVLPVSGYQITNTFGAARSYYSSGYHTGLDFNTGYGAPIVAIANGVITSASYDGAYGNKTVLTLEDGTEIWFCHQSKIAVSVGDEVHSGELIGYVGDTGHAYGSHLHLEYHPGGGDAADPFEAFVQHGVTP